eukprot:364496-Chlamydomonas_euryale.AAC.42
MGTGPMRCVECHSCIILSNAQWRRQSHVRFELQRTRHVSGTHVTRDAEAAIVAYSLLSRSMNRAMPNLQRAVQHANTMTSQSWGNDTAHTISADG